MSLESQKADATPLAKHSGPRRPRTPHWWGWIAPSLGSIGIAVGSTAVGLVVPLDPLDVPDKNFYGLLWGLLGLAGLALVGVSQAVTLIRDRRRTIAVTNFNDHLSGVHQALAHLVQSDKGVEARGEFFRSVVRQATTLLPMEGVRVCVYELDAREDDNADDETTYLKLVDYSGRADPPRPEFDASTRHGRAIITAALEQRQVTVSKRDAPEVPIDFNRGTVWRSFFVVPLVDGGHASRGVLAIDTREQTEFSYIDVAVARTLASLIVIGMDELYGAAKDTKPEVSDVMNRLATLVAETSQIRKEKQ